MKKSRATEHVHEHPCYTRNYWHKSKHMEDTLASLNTDHHRRGDGRDELTLVLVENGRGVIRLKRIYNF
jgi:hypothetical protein